jgi:hypothetical protein
MTTTAHHTHSDVDVTAHVFGYISSDIPVGMTIREYRLLRASQRPLGLLERLGRKVRFPQRALRLA